MVRVGVVDYTVGNIGSVLVALRRAGAEPVVVKEADAAREVDALLLPGVGTFGVAQALVHKFREAVLEKPTLAICLGMQLLFETSEEGGGQGLGIFRGKVERIVARKVPNIGWRYTYAKPHPVVKEGYYYFLHSYGVRWDEKDEAHIAYIQLGARYVVAVEKGHILGVQFHPERSGRQGLELIRSFLAQARR
ncbi:imidazole glycerol phosphate synthase subunit HisH [Pyrobaculum sp.]|uniref:imidazole glycerol phosphate synthase subunit HisH n=1 Tax=Pyrobaculum sp. TaxID=2004705 RepID=UPI003166FFBE